jgi:hypothetical protein
MGQVSIINQINVKCGMTEVWTYKVMSLSIISVTPVKNECLTNNNYS